MSGCKDNPTTPRSTVTPSYKVPADQYIFLERTVVVDGVTIKGEYCGSNIDFPTYGFDSAQGILQGEIDFPITDSLIAVYGDGI